MSQGQPSLSELMVRYPFTPHSRKFFDKLSIDDSFSSSEVLGQAESRLLASIGRVRYERHLSELIEFSSFFVAALVAGQDVYLGQRFAKSESELARDFFIREPVSGKPTILYECFNIRLSPSSVAEYPFVMPVEDYLTVVTRFELNRSQRWKLVNQGLTSGFVYLTENDANDIFGDVTQKIVYDGVKNLRKVAFPKQLVTLREGIVPYLPPPKAGPTRGYFYVEELFKHPVSDGRHRLTWLVLAPYLVNVKNLGEEEAVEKIRAFVAARGETRTMKRFIEYNVKRAKRNGLMPPTLSKLKAEHPDIYALLPKEIVTRYGGGAGRRADA